MFARCRADVSMVLSARQLENLNDSLRGSPEGTEQRVRQYIETWLRDRGATGEGEVVSWTYADGSRRFTFIKKG